MIVRDAHDADLPALTALYNHYVTTSHATFDVDEFAVEARRPWFDEFSRSGPHRLLVADEEGVVGYASAGRLRAKPAYSRSVETTVYVHPDHVGRGLGAALYASLLDELDRAGIHRAYAVIALPNDSSIRLHRRFGFAHVGTFSEAGYKHGRHIDVAWYERCPPI